ncbi:RNA polymerase sigma-70 factor (ECF subfamily) [Neorhizobium galegae]|uniref:RNA polymerase sigma factor n=1 Tax=Neorhizobium galegae TaxID=399 RepID=UPI001AE28A9A|nr:RNA polymerase sigma factor [Neorhizobium galegae]MBP2562766.1 RNA polymerase sigma-70 factor (ECF subfamily) [Neorhizobium galegae]MDQ0137339.1 RNA polymerase sigma-70 factor (ECF subfamily) [Neorhizobium galegae]
MGHNPAAVPVAEAIDRIARQDGGRLLSHLVGSLRDFQLAEDSLQDALESALVHWNRNGLPAAPNAWLMQVARRKAIDRLRRSANLHAKSAEIAHLIELENGSAMADEPDPIGDERLKLIFACCHPALDRKTCVALTLRSVCGLKTEEIANAFLDAHEAMAQRLVRARQKIVRAGIAYEVPGREGWAARLESVLAVVYLIFNEGYASGSGRHLRSDLCEEAIRLGRLLMTLCPEEPEIEGLLALMLLHYARRAARIGASGEILTLEAQDRRLWDRAQISEGVALIEQALYRGRPGPYQIQAAIIAVHAEAPSFPETDWQQIAWLYAELARTADNPVYELNRIVAVSYVEGPAAALACLKPIAMALVEYQPFYAVQADLLARDGQIDQARLAYRRAIELSHSGAEKLFLSERLEALVRGVLTGPG